MSAIENNSDNEDSQASPWTDVQLKDIEVNNGWNEFIEQQKTKKYYTELNNFIETEKTTFLDFFEIYPPPSLVYNCFNSCACEDVRVVVVGQDPYHGEGQAMGLSFSVPKHMKVPPSLKNIYKKLNQDVGMAIPKHGDLTSWNEQGVMLLNTALTVRQSKAGSHSKHWINFTDNVIKHLSERGGVVFILWGKHAKDKAGLIDTDNNNFVLSAAHPSPMAGGAFFQNNNNFIDCNNHLQQIGKKPIDWNSINN
jgi:uracil-DNA glycosylase